MRFLAADELAGLFTFPELVGALKDAFRGNIVAPERHHYAIPRAEGPEAALLLMPAWSSPTATAEECWAGVKVVTVFPGNVARGLPSVAGTYLLLSGSTGAPLAVLDGTSLTLWRTAAASALAASFLARPDAKRLVMVGAGALAPFLIAAHASGRPVEEVMVWNHRPERAERLAAELIGGAYVVRAIADLEPAVRAADIVSCATLANAPVLSGAWLRPGTHVDLVGAFTPSMRESDDEAVRRARLYVDTRAGALTEAGDIVQPLRSGIIREADIVGDLFDLCRGDVAGRGGDGEITLFKSVGTALEDLAAAVLAYGKLIRSPARL